MMFYSRKTACNDTTRNKCLLAMHVIKNGGQIGHTAIGGL